MRGRIAAEVAVIAGIVLIVGGLAFTGVMKVRDAAKRTQCVNNLKQIGIALSCYHAVYSSFPAGTIENLGLPPERRLSWYVQLVPYIESSNLYTRFDLTGPADNAQNRAAGDSGFFVFVCPASPDGPAKPLAKPVSYTYYPALAGLGPDAAILPPRDLRAGVFSYARRTKLDDIKDGASNTLAILELTADPGRWADGGPGTVRGLDPADAPYVGLGRRFGGLHADARSPFGVTRTAAVVGMADGSARVLKEGVSATVVEALATIAGNEDVPGDW